MVAWQGGALGDLRGLWGVIQTSVSQRASTAQLWQAIHESSHTGTFAQVNQLRGAATAMRRARENYAAAGRNEAIVSSMISEAPWSRPLHQRNLRTQYQIVVPYLPPGASEGEQPSYITIYTTALPGTVDELDQLAQANIDQLDTPEEGATLTAGIQILAV